jgi:hypothetical protein
MIEDEDDKEQLSVVISSLKSLGFSQGEVDQIFLVWPFFKLSIVS